MRLLAGSVALDGEDALDPKEGSQGIILVCEAKADVGPEMDVRPARRSIDDTRLRRVTQ